MTRWHFVRHGPTHARGAIGWTDLPADLSDTAAVGRLAASLPADGVVVSSDLSRAVSTADAITGPRQRLAHDAQLREIHFGAWEGLSFDEIGTQDGDLLERYWRTPGPVAPPGGESWDALTARVAAVVDALNGQHEDVIAVAHFGVILAALGRAAGLDPTSVMRFQVEPLSLTRLTWLGARQGWRVEAVNRLP
ncbi:MAG: histidine phosphatase family protein [Pseudomonadota bacterium]